MCVPRPRILNATEQAAAVAFNVRVAPLLGWGNLRDHVEVNLLGCPSNSAPLAPADFAQAVALFQRRQGAPSPDGKLGADTWETMKALRVVRDPFPRTPLVQGFEDVEPDPADGFSCELFVHPAIDIGVSAGTPVPALADGVVVYAGPLGSIESCAVVQQCLTTLTGAVCDQLSYGQAVLLEHPRRASGVLSSVYTFYGHLNFRKGRRVNSGERVKAGRILAEVGSGCVGASTGPHLHYGVAVGPPSYRLRAGGPARCQICARDYCDTHSCPRCNFDHFWDLADPMRPRTDNNGSGFHW